jgi:hypothetical protein
VRNFILLFVVFINVSVRPAAAEIYFDPLPTLIPVGGSVTITIAAADAPFTLTGAAYLQALYPTAYIAGVFADDFETQANAYFTAPGSVEQSATASLLSY